MAKATLSNQGQLLTIAICIGWNAAIPVKAKDIAIEIFMDFSKNCNRIETVIHIRWRCGAGPFDLDWTVAQESVVDAQAFLKGK